MSMRVKAQYTPDRVVVEVIQDGEEMAFVKFPDGKAIWVKSDLLDFDDLTTDDEDEFGMSLQDFDDIM